jgi:hypothetical protein
VGASLELRPCVLDENIVSSLATTTDVLKYIHTEGGFEGTVCNGYMSNRSHSQVRLILIARLHILYTQDVINILPLVY